MARLEDRCSVFRDIASNITGADEHLSAWRDVSWAVDLWEVLLHAVSIVNAASMLNATNGR